MKKELIKKALNSLKEIRAQRIGKQKSRAWVKFDEAVAQLEEAESSEEGKNIKSGDLLLVISFLLENFEQYSALVQKILELLR